MFKESLDIPNILLNTPKPSLLSIEAVGIREGVRRSFAASEFSLWIKRHPLQEVYIANSNGNKSNYCRGEWDGMVSKAKYLYERFEY